jgi:type VI protein secretion system component Hcp
LIGALSPSLKADEMPIFGDITSLSCQGAADKTFPGFAVITFTFGDTIPVLPFTGGGGGGGITTGKPTFPDISVVKGLDDCTPLLFGGVALGTRFRTASLTVVPKGSKVAVLLVELSDVIITSDKFTEGAAKELDEVITLNYGKITITHVPSGKTFTFDVRTGRAS